MIITLEQMRTVPAWNGKKGYCSNMAREFFKAHDLDWRDFIKNGIDSEVLLSTGDILACRLVEYVESQKG